MDVTHADNFFEVLKLKSRTRQSKQDNRDGVTLLLEKLVAFQLFQLGASQQKIAKTVGRQKLWVNELVKGIPRKGPPNDNAKRRSQP